MSHSTTKNSSYTLSKYSRAYPVKRNERAARPHSSTAAPEQAMPEWQHYTNPVIRAIVDTKIATNKDIESVRLRIVWQINPSEDAEPGQQDVVFASSSLSADPTSRINVYRPSALILRF